MTYDMSNPSHNAVTMVILPQIEAAIKSLETVTPETIKETAQTVAKNWLVQLDAEHGDFGYYLNVLAKDISILDTESLSPSQVFLVELLTDYSVSLVTLEGDLFKQETNIAESAENVQKARRAFWGSLAQAALASLKKGNETDTILTMIEETIIAAFNSQCDTKIAKLADIKKELGGNNYYTSSKSKYKAILTGEDVVENLKYLVKFGRLDSVYKGIKQAEKAAKEVEKRLEQKAEEAKQADTARHAEAEAIRQMFEAPTIALKRAIEELEHNGASLAKTAEFAALQAAMDAAVVKAKEVEAQVA